METIEFELNKIYQGDCIEIMRHFPPECIDLAFADPPYNLGKGYGTYIDLASDEEYIKWCESWLHEYIRLLKPTGSLFLVNLPKWGIYHAVFLNKYLYFRRWIAWSALSEPRGKIMPAHYAILYYTKSKDDFTINKVSPPHPRDLCLRIKCVRQQKKLLAKELGEETLTDVWHDIHRIKHRGQRYYPHPCQLPEKLLERLILMASNKGDLVLDGLVGTGTTVVVAKRLGRNYIGIDIDPKFVKLTKKRLAKTETLLKWI